MSRRRKNETPEHRGERNHQRLKAAEKRQAAGKIRRAEAVRLFRGYLRSKLTRNLRAIWHHIPRSWGRRLRSGKSL